MKKVTFILAVIIMIVVSACNSNQNESAQKGTENNSVEKIQTLSGDYICTEHWNSDLIGKTKISFNNDSVSFIGIGKTTYRIKNDSVFIDMHRYEMGFAIDGNTLRALGGAGNVAYSKK